MAAQHLFFIYFLTAQQVIILYFWLINSAIVLQLGEVAGFKALTFNLAVNPPFCQTAVMPSAFLRCPVYF
jgi:hypothetical protein